MNLGVIFFVIICIGIWRHISGSSQYKHTDSGALLLNITGVVVDKPSSNNSLGVIGRQLFGTNADNMQENSLFYIVDAIRQAKDDNKVTGIVLELKNFLGADQPAMQYLGKALYEFRDSGKPVIAVGDNYSQAQYYLASFANKIFLSTHGEVDLHGFATNGLYYKSMLEKLKVTTHVFRVGAYKSAVEPFIRDDMSPAARRAASRWISELWQNYLETIATNRNITKEQVFPGAQGVLDGLHKTAGDTAKYALDNKLVDYISSSNDIEKFLSKQFGWNINKKNYNSVSIYDYKPKPNKYSDNYESIAVIFANGAIINGKETPGNVGSETTASQIRNARLDPKVKAIILRVNSPGGSVSASEVIREELTSTRAIGKPVVVSMGGIAASGGYWISTPANYIIANKSTLTGSIGIFSIINTVENILDYLGVHTDGVDTSPLADRSVTKALQPVVSQMMQLYIENYYKRFIKLVADSRKKSTDEIENIAQGHVWTGNDAKNKGLVDQLGDFDDAIAKAAELANMKKWHIDFYQNKATIFERLMNSINSYVRFMLLKSVNNYIPTQVNTVTPINLVKKESNKFYFISDPKNSYAICLTCNSYNINY